MRVSRLLTASSIVDITFNEARVFDSNFIGIAIVMHADLVTCAGDLSTRTCRPG